MSASNSNISKIQNYLKEALDELSVSSIEFSRVLRQKDEQISHWESKYEEVKEELADLKTKFQSELQNVKSSHAKLVASLKAERDQILRENQEHLQAVEEDATQLLNQLKKSNKEMDELKKNQKSLEEEIRNLKQENEDLQKKLKETPTFLASSPQQNPSSFNEIETLNSTIAILQTEIEDLKAREYAFSQGTISGGYILEKEGEVKNLRARLETMREEMNFLRTQLSTKGKQETSFRHEYQKEIEKLKTQIIFKDEEIRCLTEDLQDALTPKSSPSSSITPHFSSQPVVSRKRESYSPVNGCNNYEEEIFPQREVSSCSPNLELTSNSKKRKFLTVPSSLSKKKKKLTFEDQTTNEKPNTSINYEDQQEGSINSHLMQVVEEEKEKETNEQNVLSPKMNMQVQSDQNTQTHTITSTGGIKILIQPTGAMVF